MFNSFSSSRSNRTLRGAVLAITLASFATACGTTTVPESSPAPTDTTAVLVEADSGTPAEVEQSLLQQSNPPQPSASNPPPATDAHDNRVPLVVPEGAELTILTALAADNAPGDAAKATCSVKGGTVSHGSTATIIIKDAEAGTTRTRTAQCQDGTWVTISDVTVNDTAIVTPEEPESPGPLGQITLPTAPNQVATD